MNVCSEEDNDEEEKEVNLLYKIKYKRLFCDLIKFNFSQISDLLRIEEEFLLDQIELDEGIGKNQLLKENLFLLKDFDDKFLKEIKLDNDKE